MRVLWFSLTPCGSVRRHSGKVTMGSWMISLEDEVKKIDGITLNVAYFSAKNESPFIYDSVNYYPMYEEKNQQNVFVRIFSRFQSLESSDERRLRLMLNVIQESKPDIIHIHGTEESFGLVQKYVKNIPIVFSIQGMITPYTEKFFSGIPADFIKKKEPIQYKLRGLSYLNDYEKMLFKSRRELEYLRNARYILGRTTWDRNITCLVNSRREYYVVNEVLRQPFYNAEWSKDRFGEPIQIVSTVSVGVYKGYETLLKAAKLLSEYARFSFKWNVIGYDRDNRCAKLSEELTGIRPGDCHIEFSGIVPAEEIVRILLGSDIYCHVSHIENSPNSVCEAMILGMPVIASFAGGTSSLLEDGKEGLLYQDGDPYSLAGKIVSLVLNNSYAKQLGKKARERAIIRHDPHKVSNELLIAYSNILKKNG